MHSQQTVLLLMLVDLLEEADAIRPCDPLKAAQLDDAADDLRSVIAEPESQTSADVVH
jgi:hypothetical protein